MAKLTRARFSVFLQNVDDRSTLDQLSLAHGASFDSRQENNPKCLPDMLKNPPRKRLVLGIFIQPGAVMVQKSFNVNRKRCLMQTPRFSSKVFDAQPIFSVDARALRVFRTLFFNPEVTSTPGSIPWGDFLHAMASTGFQIEKLYGSVWQFSPTILGIERGIHFHEPHPKGKIPFEVARRHGRRLTRAYGWFGGMFVLKEKQ
ncbi:uncharacterized protein FFFS_15866 [Fusarium fujikuroi]|nr:uncharacterized protein FFFS_15866 [Fusarium fujikuroi]